MVTSTAKNSSTRPFAKFLQENRLSGPQLLQALDWEATEGDLDSLAELRLDDLVNTAAKDAARQDAERPLDQQATRKKYFKLFEELEAAGWGRVMVGRRGHPTRFVFHEGVTPQKLNQVLKAIGVERRSLVNIESSVQGTAAVSSESQPSGAREKMGRDEVVRLLQKHEKDLRRLGVGSLYLFGPLARDEARPDSYVDLLVSFDGRVTSDKFFDTKFFLEDVLDRRVDLVTESALRDRVRREIEPELIRVA